MSVFDPIRALMREDAPPLARLAQSLADARKIKADAEAEVDRLSALKVTLLSSDDSQLARNRNALAEARDRVELAGGYVAEIEKRHQAAEAVGAEQARLDRYNAARKQADAAEKVLGKAYPRLCADALALLKTLTEAQLEVDTVNRDLPAGALPILDPEFAARGVPAVPREVIIDEEVERWVRLDEQKPLDDAFAREIYDVGGGWGKMPGDEQPVYLKARFRRVEYRAEVPAVSPLALASYLRLPALKGDGVAWGHHVTFGYDPALAALARGEDTPEHVVARLDDLGGAPAKPVAPAPRPAKVEWEMLGYVEATGMTPGQPYTSGRSQPLQQRSSIADGRTGRRAGAR